MHEIFSKTLDETDSEPEKEAIGKNHINKSPSTKVRKSPGKKSITEQQTIASRKSMPKSTSHQLTEQQERYSPTGIYNILEDDKNEIANTFAKEQSNSEEDTESPNVTDEAIYNQIKTESIEMDEIYLEDEFHESTILENEVEDEENDEISGEITKEDDESFKVNSEEESTDSNDCRSNLKIEIIPGKDQLFRLVYSL